MKDVIFSFLTSEEVQLNRIDAEDPEISDYIMIPDTGRLADSPRVCLQVVMIIVIIMIPETGRLADSPRVCLQSSVTVQLGLFHRADMFS